MRHKPLVVHGFFIQRFLILCLYNLDSLLNHICDHVSVMYIRIIFGIHKMQCNKSRLILREMNIQSLRKKAERILSDEILPAVELPYLPQNSVRQRNPIPVSFNREIDVIRQRNVNTLV